MSVCAGCLRPASFTVTHRAARPGRPKCRSAPTVLVCACLRPAFSSVTQVRAHYVGLCLPLARSLSGHSTADRPECRVATTVSVLPPARLLLLYRAPGPGRPQCRFAPTVSVLPPARPLLRHSPSRKAGPPSVSVCTRHVGLRLPLARLLFVTHLRAALSVGSRQLCRSAPISGPSPPSLTGPPVAI